MTLVINVTTPEGIVMATDSRQTYRNNKQMSRIVTDSAYKLFAINDRIMVGVAGLAFFADETGVQKNVSKYVDEYRSQTDADTITVEEVAYKLQEFINIKYPWEQQLQNSAQQLKMDIEQQGGRILALEEKNHSVEFRIQRPDGKIEEGHLNIESVDMIISGYNKDGQHETYEVHTPGEVARRRSSTEFGSTWIGQGDVTSRIVLGFDGRIANLPMMQDLVRRSGEQEIQNQLRGLEYNIQWGTMTLQDAVDFATLMIKTTSAIQRFSDGINADVGDMPGVGGPIDVAVITAEEGVQWINRKKIYYHDNE